MQITLLTKPPDNQGLFCHMHKHFPTHTSQSNNYPYPNMSTSPPFTSGQSGVSILYQICPPIHHSHLGSLTCVNPLPNMSTSHPSHLGSQECINPLPNMSTSPPFTSGHSAVAPSTQNFTTTLCVRVCHMCHYHHMSKQAPLAPHQCHALRPPRPQASTPVEPHTHIPHDS